MCRRRLVTFLKGPLWLSQPYLHFSRYFGSGTGFLRDFFSVGSLCDARVRSAALLLEVLEVPIADGLARSVRLEDGVARNDESALELS